MFNILRQFIAYPNNLPFHIVVRSSTECRTFQGLPHLLSAVTKVVDSPHVGELYHLPNKGISIGSVPNKGISFGLLPNKGISIGLLPNKDISIGLVPNNGISIG